MRLPCLPYADQRAGFEGARHGNWTDLAKNSVDALKCPPTKDREILWDNREAVRGFGVVAFRDGGKYYVVQYRKDGRSRRTRLGEHGRLTPTKRPARKEAKRF